MWNVFEVSDLRRTLRGMPRKVLQKYEVWKAIVRVEGPMGLRRIRGFNDEALQGRWKGHRSSRLDLQYRLIYRVEAATVRVLVERISAHGYR